MTSFRCAQNLLAYSGGTVRDSHPVLYSPAGLLPHPQALKRNIYLPIYDTRSGPDCQSKKPSSRIFLDIHLLQYYIDVRCCLCRKLK